MWNHILSLISDLASEITSPSSWRFTLNGTRDNNALQSIEVSTDGAEFTVLQDESEVRIIFRIQNSRVIALVNDELDPNVRATISLRHQILRPFIFAFEARNVSIGDQTYRFRFETPA